MEASKFGFGATTPPAFVFNPTDADIVAHYLLPRALGLHNPHAHAIIEDDPCSAPPWEVLKRHGHEDSDHAFFFGPPTDASSRTVRGGVWQRRKGKVHEDAVTLVHPAGGGEVDIRYRRHELDFSVAKRECERAGYVMHEYQIVSPPLPGTVLTRIKVHKNAYRPPAADADAGGADGQHADLQVPGPEQPGPSHEHDAPTNGDGFAGAQDGALDDRR
jgi:hypothetical protein